MAHKNYGSTGNSNKKSYSGKMSSGGMSNKGGDMKGTTSEKSYYRPMDSYGKHKEYY